MKIGIVSLFYKNYNYGGKLQAYALTHICNTFPSCNAEEICVIRERNKRERIKKLFNFVYVFKYVVLKIKGIKTYLQTKTILSEIATRNSAFQNIDSLIPHTSNYLSISNIEEYAKSYDLIISGSDQVWNYSCFDSVFFLDFVCKKKISYAASIGHEKLPLEWEEKYKNLLKDYSAISVREKNAVDIIQPLSKVPVEWVLDPTLLLSASEWDEICSERIIDGPYMFCYFLGGSERDRLFANEVAKEKNLQIVALPHLLNRYRSVDEKFGDIQLWNVTPQDFVSLIKNAEFVLTDSFHGAVFSTIYKRPFAVFEREGAKGMNGRVESLVDLTDTENRFLNNEERINPNYICSLPLHMPEDTNQLKAMREKSISFLKRNIEACKKENNEE